MKYKKIGKGHEDKRMLNDLDRNCTVLELFLTICKLFVIAINQGNCPVEILHVITGVGPMEIF